MGSSGVVGIAVGHPEARVHAHSAPRNRHAHRCCELGGAPVSLGGPARSGDRRLLPIIVVILLVVNGGLIAGVLLSPSASAPDTAAVYAEAAPSVATIYVMEPGGERQGSGWVYDEEHLVTNQHVVGSDPTRIFVRFQDDAWSEATLVGADVYTDLAVVTVEEMPAAAAPLPLAAAPPAIGEHSVAIGSPEGTKQTVTAGVISGLHRSNAAPTQFLVTDMIQTEASLNNGDSGGPLLDAEGRVIGVVRATFGENIGYAVSAATVAEVVPELITDGEYLHPYLGVETVPMTAPLAIANDRPYHAGVGVVQTIPDTPAAAVLLGGGGGSVTSDGITRPAIGDIIVGVAGRPVRDNERLGTLLRRHGQPGEPLTLTIIRDGTERTVTITPAVRPPPG